MLLYCKTLEAMIHINLKFVVKGIQAVFLEIVSQVKAPSNFKIVFCRERWIFNLGAIKVLYKDGESIQRF